MATGSKSRRGPGKKKRGNSAPGDKGKRRRGGGGPHLKDASSIERLRDHVEAAAKEIDRLRRENEQLAESLKVLWSKASEKARSPATVVEFDESPDELKAKVSGFIAAVDRYLNEEDGAG